MLEFVIVGCLWCETMHSSAGSTRYDGEYLVIARCSKIVWSQEQPPLCHQQSFRIRIEAALLMFVPYLLPLFGCIHPAPKTRTKIVTTNEDPTTAR